MVRSDPYNPTVKLFECTDCRNRVNAAENPIVCPRCGGDMTNIAVARE